MSWIMIDYPNAVLTRQQRTEHPAQTAHLIPSKVFNVSSRFAQLSLTWGIKLVQPVRDFVKQAWAFDDLCLRKRTNPLYGLGSPVFQSASDAAFYGVSFVAAVAFLNPIRR